MDSGNCAFNSLVSLVWYSPCHWICQGLFMIWFRGNLVQNPFLGTPSIIFRSSNDSFAWFAFRVKLTEYQSLWMRLPRISKSLSLIVHIALLASRRRNLNSIFGIPYKKGGRPDYTFRKIWIPTFSALPITGVFEETSAVAQFLGSGQLTFSWLVNNSIGRHSWYRVL